MSCARLLHLNLHVTLRRIHIIELFLAALACVILINRVYILLVVIYLANALHSKTQLIEARIGKLIELHRKILFQCLYPEKHRRTEIKIIAQATRLPVYRGCIHHIAVNLLTIIGIAHDSIPGHRAQHSTELHLINIHTFLAHKQQEFTFRRDSLFLKPHCRLQQTTCHNPLYIIFCHFLIVCAKIIKRVG